MIETDNSWIILEEKRATTLGIYTHTRKYIYVYIYTHSNKRYDDIIKQKETRIIYELHYD